MVTKELNGIDCETILLRYNYVYLSVGILRVVSACQYGYVSQQCFVASHALFTSVP